MASVVELAEMACDTMESAASRAEYFEKIVNMLKSMDSAEAGQRAATLLGAFEECAKTSETPPVHAASLRLLNAILNFPDLRDEATKKRILPVLVKSIKETDFEVLCEALAALNVFEPELLQDPAVCSAIAQVLKTGSLPSHKGGVDTAAALLVSIITDAALPFRQMASSMCLPALLHALRHHRTSEALYESASEAVGKLLDATLSALAMSPKASLLAAADAAVLVCIECLHSEHGAAAQGVWSEAAQALPTLLSVHKQQVHTFHANGGLALASRLPRLPGQACEDTADALLVALTGQYETAAAQQCDMPGISNMIDSITQVLSSSSCSSTMEQRASQLLTAASALLPLVQQREEEAAAAASAPAAAGQGGDSDDVPSDVSAGTLVAEQDASAAAPVEAPTGDTSGAAVHDGDNKEQGAACDEDNDTPHESLDSALTGSKSADGGLLPADGAHHDSDSSAPDEAPARECASTSDELYRARASSQASISAAQADVAAAAAAVTALRQQEQELTRKGDALRSSQRKLQASLQASEEDIVAKEAQLQRLQARLEAAGGAVKDAKQKLHAEKEALVQLQAEAEQARAAADEAEASVLAAKQDESDALRVAKLSAADDASSLEALEKERNALQQRIEDTKKQCSMLQSTLESQVQDSKVAVSALQAKRRELEQEKEGTAASIAQLEQTLQTLREHRTPLQSQVQEASAESAAQAQQAHEAAQQETLTARNELREAQHTAFMAKEEAKAAQASIEALQREVSDLKAHQASIAQESSAQNSQLIAQLAAVTAERDELRQQVIDTSEAMNAKAGSDAHAAEQLRVAHADVERLQAAALRSAEEAKSARASAAAADAALQAASASHKQSLAATQGELAAVQAQLVALKAGSAAAAAACDAPDSTALEPEQGDAGISVGVSVKASAQVESMQSEIAALQAELASVRSQLHDRSEMLQARESSMATLQAALREARGDNGSTSMGSPSREVATAGQLRSRVSALHRTVASYKAEVNGLHERLEQVQATSASHKKRSERFAEAIRAARAEVQALQSTVASKEAQLAAARSRAEALEKTVAETDGLAAEAAARLRNTVEQRDIAVSAAERRWFARVRDAEKLRMEAEAASQQLRSQVREHAPHLLDVVPSAAPSGGFAVQDDMPALEVGSSVLEMTQRAQEAEAKVGQLTAEREEIASAAMQHVQLAKQFVFAGIQAVQALAQAHARALLQAVEQSRAAAVSKVEAEVASRAAAVAAASAQKVAAALIADDSAEGMSALELARAELQRLQEAAASTEQHDPHTLLAAASSMVPEWLTPALRSVLEGSAMQEERPEVQAFFAALASTVRAFVGRRCEDMVRSGGEDAGGRDGTGTSFEHMFSLVEQVLSRAGLDDAVSAAAAARSGATSPTSPSRAVELMASSQATQDEAFDIKPSLRSVSAGVMEQLTRSAFSALAHLAFSHLQGIARRKRILSSTDEAAGVPVSVFREWMRSRGLCATTAVRAQRKGRLGAFVSACLSYADVDVLLAGAMSNKASSGKALLSMVEFSGILQAVAQRTYDEHFAQAAAAHNMWLGSSFFNCQEELAWQTISHFSFIAWQLGPTLQATMQRTPQHSSDTWVQCLDKTWRDSAQLAMGDSIMQAKFKLSATADALHLSQQPFAQLFSCVDTAAGLAATRRAASPGAPKPRVPPTPAALTTAYTVQTVDESACTAAGFSPAQSPGASAPHTPSQVPRGETTAEDSPQRKAQTAPAMAATMQLMRKNTQQLKAVFKFYLNTAQKLGMTAPPSKQRGTAQPVTTVPLLLVLQSIKDFEIVPDLVDVHVAAQHVAAGFLSGSVPEARSIAAMLLSKTSLQRKAKHELLEGVEVHFSDFVHMLAELACFAAEGSPEQDVWDVSAEAAAARASTLLSWMELSSGKQAMHKARGVACGAFIVNL